MLEFKLKHLQYIRWASVYWNLRPFVRPYGNVGEGRLDFYHGSLNEVVRRRFVVVVLGFVVVILGFFETKTWLWSIGNTLAS